MNDEHYDVLIVGAGPAGCAAGIVAARGGLRVGVFDRATFPRPKTCGDALSRPAITLIDELVGHHDALRSLPHAEVRAGAAIFPNGRRVTQRFDQQPGLIVPRLQLDDLLRRALQRSGAKLYQGTHVGRVLHCNGRAVGVQAGSDKLSAKLVIAADGPGSIANRALGLPYPRGIRLAVAITSYREGVTMDAALHTNEHYLQTDLKGGYGWIFPSVQGVCNIGIYQRVDHFKASGCSLPERLQHFIAAHPERFGSSHALGRPQSWALPVMTRPWPPAGPGLLSCGDAAGVIDPLSGEGIFAALHSGMLAGRTALGALPRRGVTRSVALRYRLECLATLGIHALTRFAIQQMITEVVQRHWYRQPWLQRLLQYGYDWESH